MTHFFSVRSLKVISRMISTPFVIGVHFSQVSIENAVKNIVYSQELLCDT